MHRCFRCEQELPLDSFYDYELVKSKPKCKDCRRAYERERYRARPADGWRNKHLKREFGITQVEYEAMHTVQGGKCAICGNETPNKSLAVDHDHETGRVRALLCGPCNSAIGLMYENPQVLRSAAEYLEAHRVGAGTQFSQG